MPSQSKRRSQGGGRTPNSEPRVQTFKEFGGCNFELSPRAFTLGKDVPQEQSDLSMNFVVIQNNICITSNKTIETRNNIVELFEAPENRSFVPACILINGLFYIGLDDGSLVKRHVYNPGRFGDPDESQLVSDYVTIEDVSGAQDPLEHHWSDFEYIDNEIVGLTDENVLWTGDFDGTTITNAKKLNAPLALDPAQNFVAHGLTVSYTYSEQTPFRIKIAYTYINKFGPSELGAIREFYCNYPVNEWNGERFLEINSVIPRPYRDHVTHVELYYAVGDSSEFIFLARCDAVAMNKEIYPDEHIEWNYKWNYNWTGYVEVIADMDVANLVASEENHTLGPHASRVACIDSKLYFWGDSEKPERLWIGGNPGNLYSTAASTGGGYVDVEPGTNQAIRSVLKYKTQSGNSIVTLMCDAPNTRKERRYNLVESSAALSNDQAVKSWKAEHVAGSIGCKSKIEGAVACADGLYSISRYGVALTTMTMEYNSQIRTNYISDPIKPVFTDRNANILEHSVLLECDGVLYVAFGRNDTELDNILFCYDIDGKAWWTITLDIDEPILNLIHIDYEGTREGIGIITNKHVYLLPTTHDDDIEENPDFDFVIQTGELATTQPQSNWIHLSQLEFRFDYFIGTALIELTGIDQFGRTVTTKKKITHSSTEYNLAEYLRVDLKLQSYQIRITGRARFRLSHFMAKLYTISNKQSLVWGFDDSQSFRSSGDIHPTFKCYNDIREAVMV